MRYIGNKTELVALLERHDFNFKKMFGQNFLIDTNILKKIVRTAGVTKDVTAIEIGPGAGALTQVLAEEAKEVHAFEIDHKLLPLLEETVLHNEHVTVYFEDFLKTDLTLKPAIQNAEAIRVVANLPYYITTPILEKLINWYVETGPNLLSATVMMQKEVAERLAASPNTKAYGSLSIFIQLFADVKLAFTVSKNVFIPAPNIDSAIVQLTFKQNDFFDTYQEAIAFTEFVRSAFTMRRKTLANNLKANFTTEQITAALEEVGMLATVRAEQIAIADFVRLFRAIEK